MKACWTPRSTPFARGSTRAGRPRVWRLCVIGPRQVRLGAKEAGKRQAGNVPAPPLKLGSNGSAKPLNPEV